MMCFFVGSSNSCFLCVLFLVIFYGIRRWNLWLSGLSSFFPSLAFLTPSTFCKNCNGMRTQALPSLMDGAPVCRLRYFFSFLISVEEWEEQEAIAREKARLQEMDEEEYDALTEEQKIQFDNELLQALRERKRR